MNKTRAVSLNLLQSSRTTHSVFLLAMWEARGQGAAFYYTLCVECFFFVALFLVLAELCHLSFSRDGPGQTNLSV